MAYRATRMGALVAASEAYSAMLNEDRPIAPFRLFFFILNASCFFCAWRKMPKIVLIRGIA